ncbi:Regulator of G-protein signaling loco [Amphibalanus amphitrite]|uniref:Regulator of G-protein signaling loco n=1 Tax=Amphibalanus amphitrite TaxID=1232801 RepID=A0A6A4W9Z9_AMPAM|nr:Regulator of G-protein signaling loco [Amphibalanus amphitrite]
MDVIESMWLRLTPKTTRQKRKQARREPLEAELEPEAKQRWTKGQSFRRRLNRRALSPPPASRGAAQPAASAAAASTSEEDPQLAKAYGNVLEAAEHGSQTDSVSAKSERTGSTGADQGGRAASWASSFERLLDDPAGLHTFAEFLKSQFSHENIYFWVACERYKQLSDAEARRQVALQIYERHLCVGAPEPVNVDSQAQQAAQDGVDQAAVTLFDKAQQQIFTLMKFDCFPRFLKASIYTNCVSREAAGQPLPYLGGDALDPDLRLQPEDKKQSKSKGGKQESGERRRKSLLPWHRKDRSKSKDRGEADYKRKKRQREREETGSVRSDLSGSRSSLASADLANLQRNAVSRESLHVADQPAAAAAAPSSAAVSASSAEPECLLCRVVLPDSSSAVVQAAPGDSVRTMLQRLIDRRGLPYNSWDVYLANSDRVSDAAGLGKNCRLDQSVDSCCLGCKEIRMEQRVLFRVDLPNQKTIGVKAKPNRQTCEVLRPILNKYGCKLENVNVFESGGGAPLDSKVPVTQLDNRHLVVRWRDETPSAAEPPSSSAAADSRHRAFPSLDEITNRVFDDLLKGKADGTFDDFGVIDLDQNSSKTDGSSSDRSAGPLASLVRRNSLTSGREVRRAHRHQSAAEARAMGPPPPPPPPRLADPKETDVALYEGLKRAQMCRLDDQRGTEINFELPDFLRKREAVQNKENYRPERLSAPVLSRRPGSGAADARLSMVPGGWRSSRQLGGILPTDQQAEDYFQGDFDASGRLSLGLGDSGQLGCPPMPRLTPRRPEPASPPPPTPPDPMATSLHLDEADFSPPTPLTESSASARPRLAAAAAAAGTPPPPLPPKPKVLLRGPPPRPPARAAPTEELASGRSRKAIYLDKAERLNISFV